MRKIAVFAALFLIAGTSPAWSVCGPVDHWIDEQAASEIYPVKAGGMLLRGFHRIIESPVELGYHIYDGSVHHEYGVGVLKGFGSGTLWMIDSILRGTWDFVTFAFPDYHGEPGEHHHDFWGTE